MKRLFVLSVLMAAVGLCLPLAGCETSHTESDTPRLLGGNTHKETTVTENPITGGTSVSHTEQTTR
jgi:ABC-type oligopeptide transport system substrate-binding subunit